MLWWTGAALVAMLGLDNNNMGLIEVDVLSSKCTAL
jgi:hypothetical protein